MEIPVQNPRPTARAPHGQTITAEAPTRTIDVPTQRGGPRRQVDPEGAGELFGGLGSGSVGAGATPPTEAPPLATAPGGKRRRAVLVVAVTTILALGGGGTALAYVQRAEAATTARVANDVEAAAALQTLTDEQHILQEQNSAVFWANVLAERAAAVVAANASLDASRAALAAAPQAGDEARNALQAAIDSASAVVAAVPTASVSTLNAAVVSIAAPQAAAAAAQAAWQVAEDARVAAANAAAQAAAQAQAAARAKSTAKAPKRASAAAPAPAAGAAAPATNVPEFSAGALGGAINAWRAEQGLPAMSVSRSAGLVAHAGAMAEAGDIWHSGNEKIVGYVQPASAGALVQAWANSPGHRAWMARTDKSAMQVGAVVLNNRLYGAVNFT